MDYLVSILAAVGGLVAGAGFGVALTRRQAASPPPDDRVREMTHRLREKVSPVLERRAEILGIPVPPRVRIKAEHGSVELDGDEVERLSTIAEAIRTKEEADSVALSDTVQISKKELEPIRDSKRPASEKSAKPAT